MDYREIFLSQEQVALVDVADFDWLNQWRWYANWNPQKQGFYAVRHHLTPQGNDRLIYMHRFILGLPYGDSREGDHINTSATLDNRRFNLRIATDQQQQRNKGQRKDNTTGYKGVSFDPRRQKYLACICLNRKTKNLGRRDTAEEAYALYCEAARQHFGEFANLGKGEL